MSSIFPRWTNHLPTAAAAAVPVLGLGVAVGVTYFFSPYYTDVGYSPEQPVAYSHELHAGEMGIDCRYCHNTIEYAGYAAVPATGTCMNCHKYVGTERESLAAVRESWDSGESIPWMKIHQLPDYAYFNHSVHVSAGVGCVSCHGRVDHMEEVYLQEPLSMGWCMRCHRNAEVNLRPPSEVTNMAWSAEEEGYDVTQDKTHPYNTRGINPPQNCSGCHR
ncbi:MAG: cytochrome c3 family protein [Myxococcota bacterium]